MVRVRCPRCPRCGSDPLGVPSDGSLLSLVSDLLGSSGQAWCPNEECDVYVWDPTEDAQAQLADAHAVEMVDVYLPDDLEGQ